MLTRRQYQLLAYVAKYQAAKGYSPSYEEIRAGIGFASREAVFRIANQLEARGYITKTRYRARSIEIVKMPVPMRVPWAQTCPVCGQEVKAHDP